MKACMEGEECDVIEHLIDFTEAAASDPVILKEAMTQIREEDEDEEDERRRTPDAVKESSKRHVRYPKPSLQGYPPPHQKIMYDGAVRKNPTYPSSPSHSIRSTYMSIPVYMSNHRLGDGSAAGQQAGAAGSVAGEHPYGEHPSRTLFVRNINSNVEDTELRALFEILLSNIVSIVANYIDSEDKYGKSSSTVESRFHEQSEDLGKPRRIMHMRSSTDTVLETPISRQISKGLETTRTRSSREATGVSSGTVPLMDTGGLNWFVAKATRFGGIALWPSPQTPHLLHRHWDSAFSCHKLEAAGAIPARRA